MTAGTTAGALQRRGCGTLACAQGVARTRQRGHPGRHRQHGPAVRGRGAGPGHRAHGYVGQLAGLWRGRTERIDRNMKKKPDSLAHIYFQSPWTDKTISEKKII